MIDQMIWRTFNYQHPRFNFNFFPEYSESDYDDSIDEYNRLKTRADPFEKEFKYGTYEAIMNGKIPNVKLADEGKNNYKVEHQYFVPSRPFKNTFSQRYIGSEREEAL